MPSDTWSRRTSVDVGSPMPDRFPMTAADFRPHLGTVFRFSSDGSRWFELTLLEIEERAPGVFSLFLRGPHHAPQNVFQVRHDVLAVMDLFMVPIGREGDQFRYQISFN